jgi:thiamine transport system substrate-binding protein
MERSDLIKAIVATVVVIMIIGTIVGAAYLLTSMKEREEELVIYCYDSFVSWGLGPEVRTIFEEKYGVNVSIVKCGDVGGLITRLDAEKGHPRADVALGIDNSMLHIALDRGLLDTYRPPNIVTINSTMSLDPDFHVVPYDYGYIAIICNRTAMDDMGIPYPRSLMDLSHPEYDGRIMLIDPATSSTGSSFLCWAASVAGDDLPEYLEGLSDNANGRVVGTWDAMYSAFMAGEAPIAISYGLDTASEMLFYGTNNTVTIVPEDEGYRQIEGCGIVKGARHRELAEKFVEFCLTDEFQSKVGYNVMLPVVPGTYVEPIFLQYGDTAATHTEPSQEEIRADFGEWLDEWDRAFT